MKAEMRKRRSLSDEIQQDLEVAAAAAAAASHSHSHSRGL